MQIVDCFLDCRDAASQIHALESSRNLHQALQIFPANFGFSGRGCDICQ